MRCAQRHDADLAGATGQHAARHRLIEAGHDPVEDARARRDARTARGGMLRVHDGAGRRDRLDRPQQAAVARRVGSLGQDVVDQRQDEIGMGAVAGGVVVGRRHLRVRTCEIDLHSVALYAQRDHDVGEVAGLQQLHVIGERVGPVRDLGDDGAGLGFGEIEHIAHAAAHLFGAVAAQADQPPLHALQGRKHRLEVAPHVVGNATVVEEDIAHFRHDLVLAAEPHRPHTHALLEHLGEGR